MVTNLSAYLYDGARQDLRPYANDAGNFIQDQNFGLDSGNTRAQTHDEFRSTHANHLGIPLPAGRIRLYRRDADGQREFVGENAISHTPTDDTVKITTGSAFDIKGSRRQRDFSIDQSRRPLEETFEIKLNNPVQEPVAVNVLEHLYRGDNWEMEHKSANFTRLDSRTIQFPAQVQAKGDATLTYSVRYSRQNGLKMAFVRNLSSAFDKMRRSRISQPRRNENNFRLIADN